jgi:hypothetical protein
MGWNGCPAIRVLGYETRKIITIEARINHFQPCYDGVHDFTVRVILGLMMGFAITVGSVTKVSHCAATRASTRNGDLH